ncbi:PREDICTED: mitogen-activated protein kinase kinase kinase 2-like [Ipomoea nil]|uniref:mitogen-activated protein kinase kinase kinase 2-like n=1 Tax=Ipomoea nil TaxID=35883 RepID=UPI000901F758|nr:PREDICTED: mitogen-activated protein kinase kinase kinase 2-like [Ipomoea nil]
MKWIRGKTIGCGSSATVSIATSWNSGETFAVKSAELSKSEFLQREQQILSSLRCPQIVEYKGCDITMEENKLMFNLLLEHMPAGTLAEHGGRIGEARMGEYAGQIAQGLDYLHSVGVVHCDIKGRNILVGNSGVKIADLGCSKRLNPAGRGSAAASIGGGTPMFMAPEVAQGKEQGFAADIWALGCTVIEMATGGSSPWPNFTGGPAALLYHIAFSGESPPVPDFLSDKAKDFLEKCLRRDPGERWTAKQLLKHPFLQEINSLALPKQESIIISPTSVLDQCIWNSSMEESQSTCEHAQTFTTSSSDSPKQRVRQLCWNSRRPNWEHDDEASWISVRSRGEDDTAGLHCHQENGVFGADTNSVVNFLDYYKSSSSSYVPLASSVVQQNIVNSTLKHMKQRVNQSHLFYIWL